MKAITIWQPWASLIALGEKKIETRPWKAPDNIIGQRIAIHAGKQIDFETLNIEPFTSVLTNNNILGLPHNLPTGCILATAVLADCSRMYGFKPINGVIRPEYGIRLENGIDVDGGTNEYKFGYYTPGRYAWILEDIKHLEKPVPAKGQQKLWNWDGDFK